jgi:hypothetical protein
VGQTVFPSSVPVRVLGHRPEPTRQKLAFGTTLVEGTRYGVSAHRGKTRGLFQDRSHRSICLCFDAASGLNTVRHMRVHATYWADRFPTSPSYHTVVDDALQISHCFYSLFLCSLGQVRLAALSVFAIGENLPRGNLQLSVSLFMVPLRCLDGARAGHCATRRLRPWWQRRQMPWREQVGRGV